jgi:hypothetical protein
MRKLVFVLCLSSVLPKKTCDWFLLELANIILQQEQDCQDNVSKYWKIMNITNQNETQCVKTAKKIKHQLEYDLERLC